MSNSTTSESWTTWLLSSYASAVSASDPSTSMSETLPPPTNISRSTSSSSPWGPYVRTGRGGAGNFTWASDFPPPTEADLEARASPLTSLSHRQKALAESEAQDSSSVLRSRPRAEYLHLGRGGAGNWASTPTSSSSDHLNRSSLSPLSSTSSAYAQSPLSPSFPSHSHSHYRSFSGGSGVVSGGRSRGGAGNLSASQEAAARLQQERDEAQRRVGEDLKSRAKRDVEWLIRAPQEAVLAKMDGKRRSRSLNPPEVI